MDSFYTDAMSQDSSFEQEVLGDSGRSTPVSIDSQGKAKHDKVRCSLHSTEMKVTLCLWCRVSRVITS